jgi:hypothetical protein
MNGYETLDRQAMNSGRRKPGPERFPEETSPRRKIKVSWLGVINLR